MTIDSRIGCIELHSCVAWTKITQFKCRCCVHVFIKTIKFGDGPNTVLESTVSNTKLSEFFLPSPSVPGRELREFLSVFDLCAKANLPSLGQNSPSLLQNSVSSLFRKSALETVFPRFLQMQNESVSKSKSKGAPNVLEWPHTIAKNIRIQSHLYVCHHWENHFQIASPTDSLCDCLELWGRWSS